MVVVSELDEPLGFSTIDCCHIQVCESNIKGGKDRSPFLFNQKVLIMKLFMCVIVFILCSQTHAQNFCTQPFHSQTYTSLPLTDQQRCEAEANYMARNRITGHVWGTIGRFEGVGFGYSPNCNTCSPGNSMTLTGDASAMDIYGRWYRVRSWR